MPPWKVEPGVGHFVGQRRSTTRRLRCRTMGKSGTPEGDRTVAGVADVCRWLASAAGFDRQAGRAFRCRHSRRTRSDLHDQAPVTKRTYVTGIEFHPGNARAVHHANIRIDRTSSTRRLDDADPLPGYDGLMPRTAEYPDGHFLGWTPGQIAPLVQPELAWTLEPGSDLVVQLHMQPTGAAEEVWPEIGFYFTDRAPRVRRRFSGLAPGHRHSSRRSALCDPRFLCPAG
jgi:hypothetical protein